MAKKLKWHYHSATNLLQNEGMIAELKDHAARLAKACGEGYGVSNAFVGKRRANVSIAAMTDAARKDNLKNNTLAKVAKGGGR